MTLKKQIRLAIILPQDKAQKILIPARIEGLCERERIEITNFDFQDCENDLTGKFDVLIHKALDFYNEGKLGRDEADVFVNKIKLFIEQNPDMYVIDDFESCKRISDRKYCHDLMKLCNIKECGIEVFIPKSIEIQSGISTDSIRELVVKSELRFPILAKPLQTNNKLMSMIFSLDDVKEIETPSLVQEFQNHNGVMFKVFVLGDRYNIVQRPSIKDYASIESKPLFIDTRNVSKMGRGFHPEIHNSDPDKQRWLTCQDDPNLLNRKVLDTLCKRLSEASNLKMFGFDILVVKETGNYAIVDINQFPGYKGIPDNVFGDNLVNLVKQCHKK